MGVWAVPTLPHQEIIHDQSFQHVCHRWRF